MHWVASRFNTGPVLSILGCAFVICNAGAPRPVRFAATSLASPRPNKGPSEGRSKDTSGRHATGEELFRPAIVWLAVSDALFAVLYVSFMSLVGGSAAWCAVQNFLWQWAASATWVWTTVMALQAMAVLVRSGRVGMLLARRQHVVTWPLAALSAAPNLWDSNVGDGDGYCDNGSNTPTVVASALLLLVFAANVSVYMWGLWRANTSFNVPFSVLERYSWRTFYLLSIFVVCWMPFVMWNLHLWVHGVSPEPGSALFEVTLSVQALQGFLNSLAYGLFDDEVRDVIVPAHM